MRRPYGLYAVRQVSELTYPSLSRRLLSRRSNPSRRTTLTWFSTRTKQSCRRRSLISRYIEAHACFSAFQSCLPLQMKNSVRGGLFHPKDIKTFGIQPPSPGPMTAPLPGLTHRRSRPSLSIISAGPASGPASARAHSRSSSFVGNDSFGREQARRLQAADFDKYAEDDDEDYEDVFGKANGTSAQPMQTLQLNTRLSNKSWVRIVRALSTLLVLTGHAYSLAMKMTRKILSQRFVCLHRSTSNYADYESQIDEGYADEEDLEANLQRDKYARLSNTVTQLIDELTPSAPDFQLRDACDQLVSLLCISAICKLTSLAAQYHPRDTRDAVTVGLCSRYACNFGSSGVEDITRCHIEAASNHQRGEWSLLVV